MKDDLTQYGVGGVVAMALVKLIDYITKKTSSTPRPESQADPKMIRVMEKLEDAIKAQTEAIYKQADAVTQLYTEAKLNSQAIQMVARDTADIRSNCPKKN